VLLSTARIGRGKVERELSELERRVAGGAPRGQLAPGEIGIPPGVSREEWESLTDEQKRLVWRIYEEFEKFVDRLEHRVLSWAELTLEAEELSKRVGARCDVYHGRARDAEVVDNVERNYEIDKGIGYRLKTGFGVYVDRVWDKPIGFRCIIGRNRFGREVAVRVEVPVDVVSYSVTVYGMAGRAHEDFYWIEEVKKEKLRVRLEEW
jgi:hypothetical protein